MLKNSYDTSGKLRNFETPCIGAVWAKPRSILAVSSAQGTARGSSVKQSRKLGNVTSKWWNLGISDNILYIVTENHNTGKCLPINVFSTVMNQDRSVINPWKAIWTWNKDEMLLFHWVSKLKSISLEKSG